MASLCKVLIIGHLGRDPEVRYFPDGTAVCNVSVATTRSWKDKASGEKKEETEWHNVSFRGKMAEIVGQYLSKGRPIYVEGYLKTRKWQDKEGHDKYTTEVIATEMQMLGSRQDGESGGSAPSQPRSRSQAAPAPSARQDGPKSGTGFDDMDSDIPF